jgi:hypothetical protein
MTTRGLAKHARERPHDDLSGMFDEGMRDLLKKHGIPASLKEALSKSAARHEAKERKRFVCPKN